MTKWCPEKLSRPPSFGRHNHRLIKHLPTQIGLNHPNELIKWHLIAWLTSIGRVVDHEFAFNQDNALISIAYKLQVVYVKFVGTHEQYDRVDAQTVDHS